MNPDQFYEQRKAQFDHLPGSILFDLARNENAEWRFRKAAVEIMLDHKYKESGRVEIANVLAEVLADRAAKSEVEDVVETAIEAPLALPDSRKPLPFVPENPVPTITGPLFASVTTEKL